MTQITTETYKQFIRQNSIEFNYDGTIEILRMKQLIAGRFGSNYLTMKTHIANMQMLGLLGQRGSKLFFLNTSMFPELTPKIEDTIIQKQEKLRAEARAEAEQLLKAKVKP